MVWIILIVFKTGLVEYVDPDPLEQDAEHISSTMDAPVFHPFTEAEPLNEQRQSVQEDPPHEESKWTASLVQHDNLEPWKDLSYMHWPTLMGYYNVSLLGRLAS